jgi:hypothetical protein
MKAIEYIFTTNNNTIVNVIELKLSENSKIGNGLVIQTYHFSIEQIKNNDITFDAKNCLDCPLSNTNGYKYGKCYTHKGLQLMGLKSKLRKLHKMYKVQNLDAFNKIDFKIWQNRVNLQLQKNAKKGKDAFIKLARFGSYGEPIFLGEYVINEISLMAKNITGYTHQYNKNEYNWANKFFMASTHNAIDKAVAKNRNFRSFNVVLKTDKIENSINCPSSKEFEQLKGKKVSCVDCSLCSGNFKSIRKDIHILQH